MLKTSTNPSELTSPGKLVAGGASMAWGAELWSWIGTHEPQITSIAAMVGALVAVAGFLLTLFKDKGD